MDAEQNKQLIRHWVEEVWNNGNLWLADETLAENYTLHDPSAPGMPSGTEPFKQFVQTYRTGFPDFRMTIDDMVAEGDKVAWRWTVRGTNTGPLMDIPQQLGIIPPQ